MCDLCLARSQSTSIGGRIVIRVLVLALLFFGTGTAGLKVDAMRCGGGACKYVYARFVGGDGKRMS